MPRLKFTVHFRPVALPHRRAAPRRVCQLVSYSCGVVPLHPKILPQYQISLAKTLRRRLPAVARQNCAHKDELVRGVFIFLKNNILAL